MMLYFKHVCVEVLSKVGIRASCSEIILYKPYHTGSPGYIMNLHLAIC